MQMLIDVRALKASPSIQLWEAELLRIKTGGRRSILTRASYEEWIEQVIEDSSDSSTSESMFLSALDRVVQAWQPQAADWDELNAMIGLIAAFTPRLGYKKLFLAFERVEEVSHKDSAQVLVWILDALHQYYPVTPINEDDDSYSAYLNLLRHCVGLAGCGRAAARRLVERTPDALLDRQILRIIQNQPAFLSEMIDLALSTPGESLQSSRLSFLHESAVHAGSESLQAFVEAIEARDGTYEYRGTEPRVILPRNPKGVRLRFRFDQNARSYVALRTEDVQHQKADIIHAIEEQARALSRST